MGEENFCLESMIECGHTRLSCVENSSKTETREERGPTPETRRRLRRDPIEELYRRGSIGAMQWASALEIRSILEAVEGRFVGETWRRIEHSDEGRGRQANRHPLDGLPPGLLTPYLDRLIPWAEKMRGRGKRGRSYLGITLEVLCAGTSLRQMDRQMR